MPNKKVKVKFVEGYATDKVAYMVGHVYRLPVAVAKQFVDDKKAEYLTPEVKQPKVEKIEVTPPK